VTRRLQPGQKVLINGASEASEPSRADREIDGRGGDGRLQHTQRRAGPIARRDHVIDYTRDDYSAGERRYDVILDNVGNRSLSEKPARAVAEGRYVLDRGRRTGRTATDRSVREAIQALLISPFVSQEMGMFLAKLSNET